jgi:hypothetical protein
MKIKNILKCFHRFFLLENELKMFSLYYLLLYDMLNLEVNVNVFKR